MKDIQTESLPCKLTPTELLEFGQMNARAVRDKLDLEYEKKSLNADYKLRIDARNNDIVSLTACINSGQVYRDVEIKLDFNRIEGVVHTVRKDTGEIVRTRPMTPAEQQGVLDLMMSD